MQQSQKKIRFSKLQPGLGENYLSLGLKLWTESDGASEVQKAIKKIPGQHVSLCLSPVGPAYYLIRVNAAILARKAALFFFLLAEKLCVSASMPKPLTKNNLVSLNCQLFRK